MNEQPAEIVSQVFAFLFIAISFFSYIFSKPKAINLDYFELGNIYDNAPQLNLHNPVVINKPKPVVKSVKKKKPNPKKQKTVKRELSPLEKDCIDSLRSMGMTKTEAVKKASHIFKITQPKTIQEFIMEAFKRENN